MSEAPDQTREIHSAEVHRKGLRRGLWVFVAVCFLWTLHYPLRMDRLFRAIPEHPLMGSYHRGLAREWKRLTLREDLMTMLFSAGVEEALEWRDEEGIYQTLYWLTGRHTVFGLGLTQTLDRDQVSIYGASYVGWKARPMELLWRMRWIPGLGRLNVTSSGTRYLVFRNSKTMRNMGLVLSLDIFEGTLLGVLSTNPDAVRELANRVRYDVEVSDVFCGDEVPWTRPMASPHRLWIPHRTTAGLDHRIGPWKADIASFSESALRIEAWGAPDSLDTLLQHGARLGTTPRLPGPAVASGAPFAAVVFPQSLLAELFAITSLPPVPKGVMGSASLLLSGKPYEGRVLGLALPALTLRMPWPEDADSETWSQALVDSLSRSGDLGPVQLRTYRNTDGREFRLLDVAKVNVLGRPSDQDSLFLERSEGALVLGSHLGSHLRQGNDVTSTASRFTLAENSVSANSDAVAWLWIDFPRAYEEFRNAAAIYRMAVRFSGSESALAADALVGKALSGLYAATALGEATVMVTPGGESVGVLLETSPVHTEAERGHRGD